MEKEKSVVHINFYDSGGGAAQVSEDLSDHFDHFIYCGVKKGNSIRSSQISRKGAGIILFEFLDDLLNLIFPDNAFFRKIYFYFPYKFRIALYNRPIKIRDLLFAHSSLFSTLNNLMNERKFREAEIVHLHNIHGGYFDLSAVPGMCKLNKKIVWTLHDMWLLTGGEAHTFGDLGFLKGIAYTPYDNTYPFPHIRFLDRRKSLLKKKKKILEVIAQSGVLVCNSVWLEKLTRESYVFNQNVKIKTIYPGVDTQIFFNANERNWDVIRIGFFDSGSPFKNSVQFYRIIQEVLKKSRREIRIYIKDPLSSPKFDFTRINHFADHKELNALYNQLDILIFPSIADTFPLTTLEAMACGVCVIANKICGIPEQIQSGIDGYLVDPNGDEMADVLIDLIDNKGINYVREIGVTASVKVKFNFAINKMYNEYYKIYKGL